LKPSRGCHGRRGREGAQAQGDIVGVNKPIADQFWFIVIIVVLLVISGGILYLSQASQAELPWNPFLRSCVFFMMAMAALLMVLLILRLHLRIRYENILLAQKHD
jgi:nicotinamide riboside transporter PnuC